MSQEVTPLISLGITACNSDQWIGEALDSAIGQLPDELLEIIVVDDGSTDRTSAILQSYAGRYPSLCVVHKMNQGVMAARIDILSRAIGKYVMFLDGDDRFAKEAFSVIVKTLEEKRPDVLFFGHLKFEGTKSAAYPLDDLARIILADDARNKILERFIYSKELNNVTFKAIRTSLIDIGWLKAYSSVRMGDDWFVSFGPMVRARNFACCAEPLYEYRMHGSSMTDAYDYSYPDTVLSMHGCKISLAHSNLGACLSERRIEVSTLIELSGAIALIPARPEDYVRYTQVLDEIRISEPFDKLLSRSLPAVPLLYRIPLNLLRAKRYRALFFIKRIASVLRRRHVGASRWPVASRLSKAFRDR